jgi:hypothetical protein
MSSNEEMTALQAHFVGHHQRIELVLHCLRPSLERIYESLKPYANKLDDLPECVATQVIEECAYAVNGWQAVGDLVRGVARLDRIQYQNYVPRLAGVSGGNSPAMMPLTAKTAQLETLFASWTQDQIAHALRQKTTAGRVACAFLDCLDALSRCWMDHVVTATTAIGITHGTKGTPNTILVERVLKTLHGSRLLHALGSLRSPLSGIGIEMRQLHDYEKYPLAEHYLDLFDDSGPEFGSHNVGWQPKSYEVAKQEFVEIRRRRRTGVWEHFYSETRPSFCRAVSHLLGFSSSEGDALLQEDGVCFGFGSSVTEVMSRLVSSLQVEMSATAATGSSEDKLQVVLAHDEFVTLQRAAAILGRAGALVVRVHATDVNRLQDHALSDVPCLGKEKKDNEQHPRIQQVIFLSLVNSCTQHVQCIEWVRHIPGRVIVVIDLTQAVANIPLENMRLGELATRPNVFFVGSLIKHARCGEGLAFLTYSRGQDNSLPEPASGWTSFLSGLLENRTVDFHSSPPRLLYDEGLEWEGGTPAWIESAYVATRILRSMPPVSLQHDYVQQIQGAFLLRSAHLLSTQQIDAIAARSGSNTLAIPVPRVLNERLPFGLDYKVVDEMNYLRIGFGIHNLNYHLDALVYALERLGLLQ